MSNVIPLFPVVTGDVLQPADQLTWDEICVTKLPYFSKDSPLSDLPFVESFDSAWNVEPTDDYGEACRKGKAYAAALIQYLNKTPCGDSVWWRIVSCIDFSDKQRQGYWVGFFYFLGGILGQQDIDLWEPYYKKSVWIERQLDRAAQLESAGNLAAAATIRENLSERAHALYMADTP